MIAATEAIPSEGSFASEVLIAREESRRLQRFLNDLLEASRIEHGAIRPSMESVDMTDVIAAVLRDLRQTGPDTRVVTAIDADCPLVRTDPLLVRHVLINLIDNALKFSPQSSKILVELDCRDDDVALRVLDRGPGLPPDAAALFDRFERLEGTDRVGGSGLGLWIAKNFIEAVGGSIATENREGGGAVFAIGLPQATVVSGETADHA